MDEQRKKTYDSWFESRIADCREREMALAADERADEAAFEKIRANVYGIFQTVFSVAWYRDGGKSFFQQKLEQIPAAWGKAYEQAERHGDQVRMQQERIKLDAATEIRGNFLALWEAEK